MNKRIWVILLALALCVAALCVGVSAEEEPYVQTQSDINTIKKQTHDEYCIAHGIQNDYPDWTYHLKSLDDIQTWIASGYIDCYYTVSHIAQER